MGSTARWKKPKYLYSDYNFHVYVLFPIIIGIIILAIVVLVVDGENQYGMWAEYISKILFTLVIIVLIWFQIGMIQYLRMRKKFITLTKKKRLIYREIKAPGEVIEKSINEILNESQCNNIRLNVELKKENNFRQCWMFEHDSITYEILMTNGEMSPDENESGVFVFIGPNIASNASYLTKLTNEIDMRIIRTPPTTEVK